MPRQAFVLRESTYQLEECRKTSLLLLYHEVQLFVHTKKAVHAVTLNTLKRKVVIRPSASPYGGSGGVPRLNCEAEILGNISLELAQSLLSQCRHEHLCIRNPTVSRIASTLRLLAAPAVSL